MNIIEQYTGSKLQAIHEAKRSYTETAKEFWANTPYIPTNATKYDIRALTTLLDTQLRFSLNPSLNNEKQTPEDIHNRLLTITQLWQELTPLRKIINIAAIDTPNSQAYYIKTTDQNKLQLDGQPIAACTRRTNAQITKDPTATAKNIANWLYDETIKNIKSITIIAPDPEDTTKIVTLTPNPTNLENQIHIPQLTYTIHAPKPIEQLEAVYSLYLYMLIYPPKAPDNNQYAWLRYANFLPAQARYTSSDIPIAKA